MEVKTFLLFLCFAALDAKHVFVSEVHPWSEAQGYCRDHYTDLSPITNDVEKEVFVREAESGKEGWLGLYWNTTVLKWMWSGGTAHPQQDLINNLTTQDASWYWVDNRFDVRDKNTHHNFFCLNLVAVREQKTWEEAMDHCAGMKKNLTSLLSGTENLLAKSEIQDSAVTDRVWIGLRFMGDRWLWMNGDPLQYQAWSPRGDQQHMCPAWTRCGALNKHGEWESRNCEEKLDFICT